MWRLQTQTRPPWKDWNPKVRSPQAWQFEWNLLQGTDCKNTGFLFCAVCCQWAYGKVKRTLILLCKWAVDEKEIETKELFKETSETSKGLQVAFMSSISFSFFTLKIWLCLSGSDQGYRSQCICCQCYNEWLEELWKVWARRRDDHLLLAISTFPKIQWNGRVNQKSIGHIALNVLNSISLSMQLKWITIRLHRLFLQHPRKKSCFFFPIACNLVDCSLTNSNQGHTVCKSLLNWKWRVLVEYY